MNIDSLTNSQAQLPSTPSSSKQIEKSAKQFEALVIGELLKAARESGEGWMGTGDDQAGSTAMDLAEQSFAESMAQKGGFGIAAIVQKGLTGTPKSR